MERAVLVALAEQAGAIALAHQGRTLQTKADGTSVTEGDRATEAMLRARIAERWPGHAILGEEQGHTRGEDGLWIIDPIDGTNNYACGRDYWCVSIAFAERREDRWEVVTGVVHQPPTARTWSARLGEGAWCGETRLASRDVEPRLAVVGTAFGGVFPRPHRMVLPLIRVFRRCRSVRVHGAAALDLVAVADGTLHGFFQNNLHPWDFAAGMLIAREAGATVTGPAGCALDPLRRSFVLAGGPQVFRALV